MSDLKKYNESRIAFVHGDAVAKFNTFETNLKVEEIRVLRSASIDSEAFSAEMTMLTTVLDVELGEPLVIARIYELLNQEMSTDEFLAASWDAQKSGIRSRAKLINYLIEHVREQRDNGPDLFELAVSEAMNAHELN